MDTAQQIIRRIARARESSPIAAPQVLLLAASKEQGAAAIEAAITHGITHFGENRVQEAEGKWPPLRKKYPQVRLHLIGPLQTNKVKDAAALFDVIETLDRPKLAEMLAKMEPCPELYIQVNPGGEPQKAGILPDQADAFIRYCREELRLPVTGLMCVPPVELPPAPHFALLYEIARRHGLKELSMGMTGDFEVAVTLGATQVRIGRALFGERASIK